MTQERKIIQIAADNYKILAVCNDGSAWSLIHRAGEGMVWQQLAEMTK